MGGYSSVTSAAVTGGDTGGAAAGGVGLKLGAGGAGGVDSWYPIGLSTPPWRGNEGGS